VEGCGVEGGGVEGCGDVSFGSCSVIVKDAHFEPIATSVFE
jgi:hypothetical protein